MPSTIRGSDNMDSADVGSGRAKAWVSFTGTGTVAINDSFNVSSITDNGTGDYTVNFTSSFATNDFLPVMGSNQRENNVVSRTTGTINFQTRNSSGTLTDAGLAGCGVFSN